MVQAAVKYGAKSVENCKVQDVQLDEDGAVIKISGQEFRRRFVVDSSFFGSPLRKKFELTKYDTKTQARALYTHMVNVALLRQGDYYKTKLEIPDDVAEGTLHHVFVGGWMWVIPFNNHEYSTNNLVSVGLMLDPQKYPLDESISAEQEFFGFIDNFPTMKYQFRNAKAFRDWVRTPHSIQFYSKEVVGDRWALLGNTSWIH